MSGGQDKQKVWQTSGGKSTHALSGVLQLVPFLISILVEWNADNVHISCQVVLLMGNYMNAGSRNQQSYGFELSYLTKVRISSLVTPCLLILWIEKYMYLIVPFFPLAAKFHQVCRPEDHTTALLGQHSGDSLPRCPGLSHGAQECGGGL